MSENIGSSSPFLSNVILSRQKSILMAYHTKYAIYSSKNFFHLEESAIK